MDQNDIHNFRQILKNINDVPIKLRDPLQKDEGS